MGGVVYMIPNINLNKEQLHYLLVNNKIFSGCEAIICESDNPYTLYKLFWNYNNQSPMPENKVKKIELLYKMQLEHSIRPVSTISYNDMIIGYEMTTDDNFQSYELFHLDRNELIYFLEKTKKILEYFTNNGIIYGDVETRNILLNRNTGEIRFCDMDNVQIRNYKMDKIPDKLANYEMLRGIDYDVHPFMHNIMTMEAYQLYLYYSSNMDIHKVFKYPSQKIIKSMKDPKEFNGKYLIKYKKKNK
jgi:hypothetical protein